MSLRPPTAVSGAILLILAVSACHPSLDGTWSGYAQSGESISLTFGPNQSLTMVTSGETLKPPSGGILKYDVLDEVFPKQLYVIVETGDTLQRRMPLGIYKIEARRLIICGVTETQRTIGGLPIGEPRYSWPTEFSGDCYGLDRD